NVYASVPNAREKRARIDHPEDLFDGDELPTGGYTHDERVIDVSYNPDADIKKHPRSMPGYNMFADDVEPAGAYSDAEHVQGVTYNADADVVLQTPLATVDEMFKGDEKPPGTYDYISE
ncbi:MAG: hypothetical protein PHN45_05005, partial [Methylococcales bacterium]|nr:hypothetical protein [Methylococcales bacterium]